MGAYDFLYRPRSPHEGALVTKKEIVKVIAEKFDQPQVLVKDIVQETFNLIVDTLVKEGRIELRNFGVFEVKLRKERRARNPKTNDPVTVAAKKVVTFQPGKVMEDRAKDAEKVVEARKKPLKGSKAAPDDEEADDDLQPVGVGGGELPAAEEVPVESPHKPR